jgi:hypothetical protein
MRLDVIPEYTDPATHGTGLIMDLKLEDFRVYDNRKELQLASFAQRDNRPITLWIVVQCPQGYPPEWHSEFMRGDTKYLRPALAHLDAHDVIGVAHWCDNGKNAIDFAPAHDADAALATLDQVLSANMNHGQNRTGEHAMQETIEMVLNPTHQATPERVPVLLFLYGDHCEAYGWETDKVIENLMNASAIVFGINNGKWKFDPEVSFRANQVKFLVHYYSQETGGDVYSTPDPKGYTAALDYILTQVHMRYTLGFNPAADGKKHGVKVELTKEAQHRYRDVRVRYRKTYFAKSK